MEYQIDTRNHRTQEVRIGRDNHEVAAFRKAGFFIYNLKGRYQGVDYEMKLPAPWTGFRYRLRQGEQELASAKKSGRMHAFDADRPFVRHRVVDFELDVHGRALQLMTEDRHGLVYVLREGDVELGRLVTRSFEAQQGGPWQADLDAPEEWSVPLAAFLAWLAREGRAGIGS